MLDLSHCDSLSFDCYGTLIDWESGLLKAFAQLLGRAEDEIDKGDLFSRFSRVEAELETPPYIRYREVLHCTATQIGRELNISLPLNAGERFAESIRDWEPFPDTVPALERLATRYRLYILSNVDDDLFASTARKLKVQFAGIITAEQVGSYKPNPRNFERLLEVVGSREKHVHVAQSLFHDHVPAQHMGIRSIWIRRGANQGGGGASGTADANFDLELPDLASLADFADSFSNKDKAAHTSQA